MHSSIFKGDGEEKDRPWIERKVNMCYLLSDHVWVGGCADAERPASPLLFLLYTEGVGGGLFFTSL